MGPFLAALGGLFGGGAAAGSAVGSTAGGMANMGMGMGDMSNILGQQGGGGGMMPMLDTSNVLKGMNGGNPNDMGGGFGTITEGGLPEGGGGSEGGPPELPTASGGTPSQGYKDMSGYNGIPSLFGMMNQIKKSQRERTPRGRMDSLNNKYMQGLMGG